MPETARSADTTTAAGPAGTTAVVPPSAAPGVTQATTVKKNCAEVGFQAGRRLATAAGCSGPIRFGSGRCATRARSNGSTPLRRRIPVAASALEVLWATAASRLPSHSSSAA